MLRGKRSGSVIGVLPLRAIMNRVVGTKLSATVPPLWGIRLMVSGKCR